MTEPLTSREREVAKIILDWSDNKIYTETAFLKIARVMDDALKEAVKERVAEKIKS